MTNWASIILVVDDASIWRRLRFNPASSTPNMCLASFLMPETSHRWLFWCDVTSGDTTTFYTDSNYGYNKYWLDIFFRNYFVFTVRACGDVHIALLRQRVSLIERHINLLSLDDNFPYIVYLTFDFVTAHLTHSNLHHNTILWAFV